MRVENSSEISVVGSVDLRYTHPWSSLWSGNPADALIGDPVVGFGVESVGEGFVVTSHCGDRLIVGDQPEAPVGSVIGNGTPGPQIAVPLMTISDEVWVLVVDIDCFVDRFHGRIVPHSPTVGDSASYGNETDRQLALRRGRPTRFS